ncbi:hypothetical protein [Polaromonas sp.]|uniref:hypothetical protein n=1 Tax=Polaromonas sp. TaxID=1869339 RepID=UPI0013B5BE22|nr:hypothetical protein [Polaromonas sp.]NDP61280.1 hypothetical protein [Polaromonas sp.]
MAKPLASEIVVSSSAGDDTRADMAQEGWDAFEHGREPTTKNQCTGIDALSKY